MTDLTGKVAVVTGAARRIGAEIAVTFAQAGCDVAINYRTSSSDAEATAKRILAHGRRVVAVPGDMSRRADAQRLLSETLAAFGRADILVANAGAFRRTPLADVTEQNWKEMLSNNLEAAFWPAQAFGVHMRARGGGAIIMIAAVAA